MGGRSIFRASRGDPNLNVMLETLTEGGQHLALAQRYVPEIVDGDKRVLLVDGVPVDYCSPASRRVTSSAATSLPAAVAKAGR